VGGGISYALIADRKLLCYLLNLILNNDELFFFFNKVTGYLVAAAGGIGICNMRAISL
jgi:hypothetical protein